MAVSRCQRANFEQSLISIFCVFSSFQQHSEKDEKIRMTPQGHSVGAHRNYCWGQISKKFFSFSSRGRSDRNVWKPEVIGSSEHFLSAKNRDNTCHKSCYNKELLCSIIVNAAAVFPVVTVCQNVTDIRTFCLCVGVCVYLMPDTISFPSARRKLRRDYTNHCVADFPLISNRLTESTHQNTATIWLLRYEHKPAFNVSLYAEVVEMHVHGSPAGT